MSNITQITPETLNFFINNSKDYDSINSLLENLASEDFTLLKDPLSAKKFSASFENMYLFNGLPKLSDDFSSNLLSFLKFTKQNFDETVFSDVLLPISKFLNSCYTYFIRLPEDDINNLEYNETNIPFLKFLPEFENLLPEYLFDRLKIDPNPKDVTYENITALSFCHMTDSIDIETSLKFILDGIKENKISNFHLRCLPHHSQARLFLKTNGEFKLSHDFNIHSIFAHYPYVKNPFFPFSSIDLKDFFYELKNTLSSWYDSKAKNLLIINIFKESLKFSLLKNETFLTEEEENKLSSICDDFFSLVNNYENIYDFELSSFLNTHHDEISKFENKHDISFESFICLYKASMSTDVIPAKLFLDSLSCSSEDVIDSFFHYMRRNDPINYSEKITQIDFDLLKFFKNKNFPIEEIKYYALPLDVFKKRFEENNIPIHWLEPLFFPLEKMKNNSINYTEFDYLKAFYNALSYRKIKNKNIISILKSNDSYFRELGFNNCCVRFLNGSLTTKEVFELLGFLFPLEISSIVNLKGTIISNDKDLKAFIKSTNAKTLSNILNAI